MCPCVAPAGIDGENHARREEDVPDAQHPDRPHVDPDKIGDSITIKILDIRQESVRIGVDAPREISVHRQVVYDKLKAQATTGRESGSQEQQ